MLHAAQEGHRQCPEVGRSRRSDRRTVRRLLLCSSMGAEPGVVISWLVRTLKRRSKFNLAVGIKKDDDIDVVMM